MHTESFNLHNTEYAKFHYHKFIGAQNKIQYDETSRKDCLVYNCQQNP